MQNIQKFEGLIAAPFTPMDKNGNLNASIINEYYQFLEKNGITAAFINGTTGEGASLSQKEKQVIATEWAKSLNNSGKVRIINLVGGTSYQECIENAIHSAELGLNAIAIIAPYYFRPDETQLAEFITLIGESVPGIPVYFYHIPSLTGVHVPVASLMKKLSGMLKNFAGIKYTDEDLMDFLSCLNYNDGKYDILWGRDESLLAALTLGAKGAVGSTYNYAAPLYNRLIKAFNNNDLAGARQLQQKSVDMINLLQKYGGISTGKAFMKSIGMDCGKFRLPVYNMSDEIYVEFLKDVKKTIPDNMFSNQE